MLAVDTSVLVGIINREANLLPLAPVLALGPIRIAATTLVETNAWIARNDPEQKSEWLSLLLTLPTISVDPFTEEMASIAALALRRFGRGSQHPAQLNFGDCLVYAHAFDRELPLLFKGNDFHFTDLRIDPRSIVTPVSRTSGSTP